jgi:hypothetical protein
MITMLSLTVIAAVVAACLYLPELQRYRVGQRK